MGYIRTTFKYLFKLVSIFISVMLVIIVVISSPAYAYTPDDNKTNITGKPGTWCQWCTPGGEGAQIDYNKINLGWKGGSGTDMGTAGCAQFSMAYMMRKAELFGSDFDPKKMYDINNAGPQNKSTANSAGMAVWSNVDAFTDGKLIHKGTLGTKEDIKKAFNNGSYVILHVRGTGSDGHWVVLDEIKGDDFLVVDSAIKGENGQVSLNKHYGGQVMYSDSHFFDPSDSTIAANKAKTVNGVAGNGGSSDEQRSSKDYGILDPKAIYGMPSYVSLAEGASPVSPPTYNEFGPQEKNTLAELKEAREADKGETGVSSWLAILVGLIGILLMIWAVIMLVTYLFDWVMFGKMNLYGVTTLGSRRVALGEDDLEEGKKVKQKPQPTGLTGMFTLAGMVFLLGIMVYNGSIFYLMGKAWELIQSLTHLFI